VSHVAVRLLADRFADAEEGIDQVSAQVPRFVGDEVPPTVAVYDETRHPWVSRGAIPRGTDGDEEQISFPCIIIFKQNAAYDPGIARDHSGGRFSTGRVTVAVQVLLQDVETANAATLGMYLLRAARGVVFRFEEPGLTTDDDRTACYTRILAADSIQEGQLKAFVDDFTVSPGALLITYPFTESVPLT
jgi:hypothetical protein